MPDNMTDNIRKKYQKYGFLNYNGIFNNPLRAPKKINGRDEQHTGRQVGKEIINRKRYFTHHNTSFFTKLQVPQTGPLTSTNCFTV